MTRGGRASRLLGRLEPLLLLAFGVGALVFASGPRYTALMNPSFRWVTLAGAALVVIMGLALLVVPRRAPGRSAVLIFGALGLLVATGRPDMAQSDAIVPPDVGPALAREGYDELLIENLFRTLSEEVEDVPEGLYVVTGRVHRPPSAGDAPRDVLLYPKVACCLADALAYAVHLDLTGGATVPEGAAWVYAYGRLRRLDTPLVTSPFKVGAIAFTAVSRRYVLEVDEMVDYRTLLEDVTEKIPKVQCGAFLKALQATGLAEVLAGEGPFTIFAPIDSAFLRHVEALDTSGSGTVDAPRLRKYVEGFVIRGRTSRLDLLALPAIETLSGRRLGIEVVNGRPIVEGARILFADQIGRNGALHIVHPAWAPDGD